MIIAAILTQLMAKFTQLVTKNLDPEQIFKMYFSSLVLIGGIYTGWFFKKWTHTPRAASLLMLPATAFEKIALVLFYTVVLFIPVFTVVFYGSHFVLSKISNSALPFSFIEQYRGLSPIPALIIYAFLHYAFFQSLFLLFSVWFKERQIVMAFGMIVVVFFIIGLLNIGYVDLLSGNDHAVYSNQLGFFPTDLKYSISGDFRIITSPLIANVNILMLAISTLLLYLVSYFKLKEKEI